MKQRMSNAEHIEMAREIARSRRLSQPLTAEDVESLTGIVYYGPDPDIIGRVQHLTVQTH
jgi:hypothetical protein